MENVQDPLRFADISLEDEEATENVPLNDSPPHTVDSSPAPAQETASDPLSPASPFPPPRGGDLSTGHLISKSSNVQGTPPPSLNRAVSATTEDPLSMSGLDNVDLGSSVADMAAEISSSTAQAAGPSHRTPARVHITVADPVKRVSDHAFIPGLTSSHFEYLVTSAPAGDAPEGADDWPRGEVRRRFSDFVALSELLAETQRGYFVFPRPDKGALEGAAAGRSETEFVEGRRGDLERYLNRLAQHPVVGRCEELKVFLTAEGALESAFQWQQLQPLRGSLMEGVARLPGQILGSDSAVPTTTDAAKNARHTNDLFRRLKEMTERMRQEYKPPVALPEDEIKLRETKAGVEAYAETLANASRRAEKLLREFEKLGAVTGDAGLSLIRLAKYEDEIGGAAGGYSEVGSTAKGIAADARRVGMAGVRMSRLARSATAESMASLEPLHTELALAPAVVDALKEREAALLTAQSIKDDVYRRQASLASVEDSGGQTLGGDPSRVRKAQNLRNEIASLEAAAEAAEAEYEKVKGRNQEELERWRGEREGEFLRMVRGYAHVTALYEERAEQVWREVAEDLGS